MISRTLESRGLELGLRLVLGGVFIYAGALKLSDPQAFADSIAGFHLLPFPLVNLLALSLPLFELAVGGFLLTGWRLRAASLGVLLMTTLFAVALASAIARGLPVDCGCFGSKAASANQGWMLLARDLLLGAAACLLYWLVCVTERRLTKGQVFPDPVM